MKLKNIFLIDGLNQHILEYSDIKTILNYMKTSKEINNINIKKILFTRILKTKYGVHLPIINLMKSQDNFTNINKLIIKKKYTRMNESEVYFYIFKIILPIIIKQNNYKCEIIAGFLDIIYLYHTRKNFYKWRKYLTKTLNNSIDIIKINKKICVWNQILSLRNHFDSSPLIFFDESLNKFINLH